MTLWHLWRRFQRWALRGTTAYPDRCESDDAGAS